MDVQDIRTIEQVFAYMDLDLKLSIDINAIINSLKNLSLMDDCVLKCLRDNYCRTYHKKSDGKRLLQLNRFLWEINDCLSFEQLLTVLIDSGNQDITNSLVRERGNCEFELKSNRDIKAILETQAGHTEEVILYYPSTSYLIRSLMEHERNEIPRPMSRYRLPHAKFLSKFYIELKVQVDDNALDNGLHNGNRDSLELMISNIDTVLEGCENPRKKQLLTDKRIALYFLLVQLYANFNDRLNILKRLHDSMPYGVDRTMFNAIYHSNMAVSWAMKGNFQTALEHIAVALEDSSLCAPCLPVLVSMMGAHITHTEVYLSNKSEDYLKKALTDYAKVSELVKEATEEEQMVWKSGTLLVMASALLGIKFFSKVCDDDAFPDTENVEKARHILAAVRQLKSLPKHRELMLYLCIGKLHEIDGDIHEAIKYIRKAQYLADSCCCNMTEKSNINAYLNRLQNQVCCCLHKSGGSGKCPGVTY